MIFAKRLGYQGATKTFVAGPEWKQVTLPFASFGNLDGSDIMGFVWCAGPKPGAYELMLDNVRLQ
jgi:hypothetical protein